MDEGQVDQFFSELKELTDNLPNVPNTQMRYDSTRATGMGFGVINNPALCIQRVYLFEDLKLYPHSHGGREWMIVVEGSCVVRYEDKEQQCDKGDYVVMEPDVEHSVEATEDTQVVLITVPGDQEGYPDGSQ